MITSKVKLSLENTRKIVESWRKQTVVTPENEKLTCSEYFRLYEGIYMSQIVPGNDDAGYILESYSGEKLTAFLLKHL